MSAASEAIVDKLRESYRQYKGHNIEVYEDSAALRWANEYHVNTRREKMDFTDAPCLYSLYYLIDKTPNMVVEKCVQFGLSELFIIQSHLEAGELGLNVMYVLPKYELRNRFVNNRIDKLHKVVPHYSDLVEAAPTNVHRVSLMHFGAGTLIYVGSNVESEFIEVPVDSAYVDEKDRCNQANLLYLPDRYTASPYRYHREISNPTIEGFGIDERYQESSQGLWQIRCDHCGKWFTPDFWEHVVRKVGENQYEALDPDFVPGERKDARLYHTCGYPVNRLKSGRWVHEYPRRVWQGFRISKVVSKFVTLGELIEKWNKSTGNDLKTQIFYNSDMGLPYSSKGAKITREMLEDCKREYQFPVRRVEKENIRIAGVDVGEVLHVIIRERIVVPDAGVVSRLLLALVVGSFTELARLLREWQPRRTVIDAMPEIHKVSELKNEFKNLWSSRFQDTNVEMHDNKADREVRMNRTALLDAVQQGIGNQDLWLPMMAETLAGGDYYKHMQSSTRILEADEVNPEKSRYVWAHTQPDHFFLAEGYCMQASMLLPRYDLFEYYKNVGKQVKAQYVRKRILSGENVEEKEKIEDLKHLTPEVHLAGLQAKYGEKGKVAPTVDVNEIWAVCEDMAKAQGYVDVFLVTKMTGENEGDVVRVLKEHLYSESRIKGQYVR